MDCEICGAETSSEALFCVSCGSATSAVRSPKETARYCTNCGVYLSAPGRYCTQCGHLIVQAAQAVIVGPILPVDAPAARYMGFWVRAGATLVDIGALVVGLIFSGSIGSEVPLLWIVIGPAVLFGVYKHLKCQTIGRWLFKLQVVDESGRAVGFWRGALREVFGKTVSYGCVFLGFVWVGIDRDKRGWHDRIARTYVVRQTDRLRQSGRLVNETNEAETREAESLGPPAQGQDDAD